MHGTRKIIWIFLLTGVLLIAAALPSVHGAETDFTIITTDQLKAMMDGNQKFTLIDTRSKEEYQEAHIPGAVSIPEKSFDEAKSLLTADKNALLVFYCNGVKCGKSKRTAKKAEAERYNNILIYGEGFPVWEEKNQKIVAGPEYSKKIETTKMKPSELKKLIDENKQDIVLVDFRDASEYQQGHIPTAINIPSEIFASKQSDLPKEKKIIVYCNTGSRSYLAYRKLMKMDYKNIYQALFADWKEAGYPVEK